MLVRVWITKKGKAIPVNQMTRSHILNCIDLIIASRGSWRVEWLEPLMLELEIRDLRGDPR